MLYAIEEEVFVTEPRRPSLQSLYYLARLLWQNPGYYYAHSASNFARGEDLRQGLMSGIEISTQPHATIDAVLADLAQRRRELAAVCGGFLVPLGHLFDYEAPTNTCGMHIHIGPVADVERVYANLAHFLPLLAALTVNAPIVRGKPWGASFRLARSYAIGPLRSDPLYRFQDMILSRRLGTIELRLFDPVWELERIRVLLQCIEAIVQDPKWRRLDRARYRRLRAAVAARGYHGRLRPLWRELNRLIPVDEGWFQESPARLCRALWERLGVVGTYAALDHFYRHGAGPGADALPTAASYPASGRLVRASRAALGVAGYYMIKLPYNLRKFFAEW